ncbi:MAG: DUF434 domain-containing protein [Ruminococcus flavefaciens]|nr:DUF434 domain-containing protein [Ruminococcus flavefaciens]
MSEVKRGFIASDEVDFSIEKLPLLKQAGSDVYYLMNRDYPIRNVITFVGNHYQLSERQRTALSRIVSSEISIKSRKDRELSESDVSGQTLYIDGFNIIITLETAFSDSTLFECMDGTVRDLAGLRGSYRLIDKTDIALQTLADTLTELNIKKAVFYLDKPVSNSGRLKQKILDAMSGRPFETEAFIENAVDPILEKKSHVVTADAIILDKCESWYNLNGYILKKNNCKLIDIFGNG